LRTRFRQDADVASYSEWPPISSAQLFSVGRFRLRIPHATRGCGPFCVCQPLRAWATSPTQFAPVLLSLLSKPVPTSSQWHTHMAFAGAHLRACRCRRLSGGFGAAFHHDNVPAAHGIAYSPSRCRVITRAW
jgi:hypothetical protein